MKTILLTGSSGFVGKYLKDELQKKYKVITVDIADNGSIVDSKFLLPFFKENKIDAICHQAALISVPDSITNPVDTHDTNVTGTLLLLELARIYNVKRFVYASSAAIYTWEDSPYGLSKKVNELYAKTYYKTYGIETIGLRYTNVYGPNQTAKGNVLPCFKRRMDQNLPLQIYGDGKQERDFVHVFDVVTANVKALETTNTEAFGTAFDIGTGSTITINYLAYLVQKEKHVGIEYLPDRPGDARITKADTSIAKRILGFSSTISPEEGV